MVFEWWCYTCTAPARTASSLENMGLWWFLSHLQTILPPKLHHGLLSLWVIIQVTFQTFPQKHSCESSALTHWSFQLKFVKEVGKGRFVGYVFCRCDLLAKMWVTCEGSLGTRGVFESVFSVHYVPTIVWETSYSDFSSFKRIVKCSLGSLNTINERAKWTSGSKKGCFAA